MKAKLSIKKNDRVMVIAGREKGKIGKVLKVFPDKGRVLVEKINMVKRHAKPDKAGQGGIIEKEAALHASNVMIMCAKCAKPVRVGHKALEDGNRVRVCIKCGEELTS